MLDNFCSSYLMYICECFPTIYLVSNCLSIIFIFHDRWPHLNVIRNQAYTVFLQNLYALYPKNLNWDSVVNKSHACARLHLFMCTNVWQLLGTVLQDN